MPTGSTIGLIRPVDAAPVSRTSFRCPECQCDMLEEVSNAITYTAIAEFYGEQEEYWDRAVEETSLIRIQCYDCQFEVCTSYQPNLHTFLARKGWLQGVGQPVLRREDWSV